jgi:hypothetical protein
MKTEQEDNYEEALYRLYCLTNFLYGGYYEPKSARDIALAGALHDVWIKFRYSEETMKTFEAISDLKNKHLFTTEKSLEYFKNVKIKES